MPRPLALLSALSLIGVLLVPLNVTEAQAESTTVLAKAELQPATPSPNIAPAAVQPDVAYTTAQGGRVEVYNSIGDNNGGIDWRQVNEFAYLLNSVPKGKQIHSTVYNTLWDHDQAKLNPTTNLWELYDSSGKVLRTTDAFGPAQALRNQLNQYATDAERKKYINLLLAKGSMRDAKAAGSGLASLIYGSKVYTECSHGEGACLITTDEEALMHAKYALFEQAADSTGRIRNNVVWVTSANLNGASGGKKSNTSIAIYDEPKGYSELLTKVWNAEVTETFTPGYLSAINGITGTNSDFTFYPSPRNQFASQIPPDFEAQFLQSKTNAALKGVKTSCKAYLVHSLFSETRSAILSYLAALQSEGCEVKVVLGENAIGAIVTTYFSMSTAVRDIINRTEFSNVHDKTLSVSYTLNGTQHGTTWGGSENFNGTSLRYDELSFRADDLTLTRASEQQSERLYQLSRGGEATIPVRTITVLPAFPQTNVGGAIQMRTRLSPTNPSSAQVTWRSSNTGVARVDAATGMVTAVGVGTADTSAPSVTGPVRGATTVTINNDLPTVNTTDPKASTLLVSSPPTLTMENYQAPDERTHTVVTWGQGAADVSGRVTLQYYKSGKWKSYTSFTVSSGRVEKNFKLPNTRTFRLRTDSVSGPSGARPTSTAKYSNGYSYVLVRTKAATTKPRLYAPPLIKGTGSTIPFVVAWRGTSTRAIQLQYRSGSRWISIENNKFSMTTNNKVVGAITTKSRSWRVLGLRKGHSSRASSSVYVKVS